MAKAVPFFLRVCLSRKAMEAESRGKKAIKRQKKVLWNEKKDVTLQSISRQGTTTSR